MVQQAFSLAQSKTQSTSILQLRDYQEETLGAVADAEKRGVRRQLVVLPTGSGKTVVFSHAIARRLHNGQAVVLVHRDELAQQAMEKLRNVNRGVSVGLVKAESNETDAHIIVASVQTLAREKRRLDFLQAVPDIGVLVVDECFPAGTSIDGVPIEELRHGDFVRSFNHATGRIERRRVERLFKRPAPPELVRIRLSDGAALTCTPNHPIYAQDMNGRWSYVPAGELTCYHMVYSTIARHKHVTNEQRANLPLLPEDVCPKESIQRSQGAADLLRGMQGEAQIGTAETSQDALFALWSRGHRLREDSAGAGIAARKGILLSRLQSQEQKQSRIRDDGPHQSAICVGAHENQQSYARPREQRAYADVVAGDGLAAADSRWERRVYGSPIAPGASAWLADGVVHSDGPTEGGWVSRGLQGGHRQSDAQNRHRGGWRESLCAESQSGGRQEGCAIAVLGVDRVAVQESGRDRESGGLCPDGFVYNLEVEGNHNYFANGLLAHNCHHSASDSYQTVLDALGAFSSGGPLTLGFTATPERSDGKSLGATWEEVVYQRSILDMIRTGYLCDIRGIRVVLEGLDLNAVKRTAGDYQDGDLGAALAAAAAPEHAVAAYQEHAAGRKALLFTPTIQLAREMAAAFQQAGIAAGWVSGELPMDVRRDALSRFRNGAVRVMCNAMVLTEGYDEPSVDCIIVARPTRAHALYVQQVGRGTRPSALTGKTDLLVIDLVGASEDNKLQTVVDLVGREHVPGKPRQGQSLLEMVDEVEEERSHHGGKLRAEVVDLFGRSGFRWLPVGEMKWLLPLQRGSMLLARDGENWAVRLEQGRETAIQQIWAGSDVGYAQGAAEDWARRQGTSVLVERTARWLKDPASDKQREALMKWRVPVSAELTKGEAADQLSLIFGKRAWGIRR